MTDPNRRAVLQHATLLSVAAAAPAAAATGARVQRIASPDGMTIVTIDPSGPTWSVSVGGRIVVAPSPMALSLDRGADLGPGATYRGARRRTIAGSWTPPYGIRSRYDQRCGELTVELEDVARRISFAIIARAYDTGAAIRFRLLAAPTRDVTLTGEATEVRLPADATLYVSRDEGEYQRTVQTRVTPAPHPDLTGSSDTGDLADTPVTILLKDGGALLISESDRLHYPRMMFRSGTAGLVTYLMRYPGRATGYSGPGDTPAEERFTVPVPFATPWRVVIHAPTQAALIERQDLIPTLATPNRLGNVDWIKPGRAVRIRDYTTAAGMATVDFAARRKLDYVEWDAHWYGDGTDPSDATYAIPAIDIRKVIEYAKSKGLGMILYVDRVPAMRQLDAIAKTYRDWGVAGIKFGFVWEGRQSDVDFIYDVVKTCGEHRLLVNLHDNLRPAGLERTLPNYVALEGVRGNEQFPTATHNCTLPFTRALSGPIDYTICFANPRNRTTNAHQLALAALYYNPLTFLYWYDSPAKYADRDWPELAFFDECPTTWTDTRALAGEIGTHCVVARQAADGRWFMGAITNERARRVDVDLSFLGTGRWQARRFADGAPAAKPWQTAVALSTQPVDAGMRLTLDLAPSGGQALIFEKL